MFCLTISYQQKEKMQVLKSDLHLCTIKPQEQKSLEIVKDSFHLTSWPAGQCQVSCKQTLNSF